MSDHEPAITKHILHERIATSVLHLRLDLNFQNINDIVTVGSLQCPRAGMQCLQKACLLLLCWLTKGGSCLSLLFSINNLQLAETGARQLLAKLEYRIIDSFVLANMATPQHSPDDATVEETMFSTPSLLHLKFPTSMAELLGTQSGFVLSEDLVAFHEKQGTFATINLALQLWT